MSFMDHLLCFIGLENKEPPASSAAKDGIISHSSENGEIISSAPPAILPPPQYPCEDCRLLAARQILEFRDKFPPAPINAAELKVFSQFGEDGIIQWLISQIPGVIPVFVEFGVENYQESNTRFLLLNNNWSGLIIDGSKANMDFVRSSSLYWRHDLIAVDAFITRDNINDLLSTNGFKGEIGILSVDMDGVDYWVLERIDVIVPQIIICEINGVFGADLAVTVPYKADFSRLAEHYGGQYFGASLKAMELLLDKKGYCLVGLTSNSLNAFFVRKELAMGMKPIDSATAWRPPKHSDTRDKDGRLTFIRSVRGKLELMRDMPLLNIETGEICRIAELYSL